MQRAQACPGRCGLTEVTQGCPWACCTHPEEAEGHCQLQMSQPPGSRTSAQQGLQSPWGWPWQGGLWGDAVVSPGPPGKLSSSVDASCFTLQTGFYHLAVIVIPYSQRFNAKSQGQGVWRSLDQASFCHERSGYPLSIQVSQSPSFPQAEMPMLDQVIPRPFICGIPWLHDSEWKQTLVELWGAIQEY